MASIRKTKKILKNSKGFLTIIIKGEFWVLALNESTYITFSKHCIIVNDIITSIPYEGVPYKAIKRIEK